MCSPDVLPTDCVLTLYETDKFIYFLKISNAVLTNLDVTESFKVCQETDSLSVREQEINICGLVWRNQWPSTHSQASKVQLWACVCHELWMWTVHVLLMHSTGRQQVSGVARVHPLCARVHFS